MQDIAGGIRPPSNVLFALMTAIFGHALWNGTAVGVAWFSGILTQSEGISIVASLITNVVMVLSVLGIGNMILKGVAEEDETTFSN